MRGWSLGGGRLPAFLCENKKFPGTVAVSALSSAGNVLKEFPIPKPPRRGGIPQGRLVGVLNRIINSRLERGMYKHSDYRQEF